MADRCLPLPKVRSAPRAHPCEAIFVSHADFAQQRLDNAGGGAYTLRAGRNRRRGQSRPRNGVIATMAKHPTNTEAVSASAPAPAVFPVIRPAGTTVDIDTATLPTTSIVAILTRGLNHIFSNEIASEMSARKRAHILETAKADGVPDSELPAVSAKLKDFSASFKAYEPDEATVASWRDAAIAETMAELAAGKLGMATRAPRGATLDGIVHRLAVEAATMVLKAHGLALPKKGECLTFANGDSRTRDDLINAMKVSKEAEFHATAQAELREIARKAEAAKAAVSGPVTSASALGF